jgi:hypothetical protein
VIIILDKELARAVFFDRAITALLFRLGRMHQHDHVDRIDKDIFTALIAEAP